MCHMSQIKYNPTLRKFKYYKIINILKDYIKCTLNNVILRD